MNYMFSKYIDLPIIVVFILISCKTPTEIPIENNDAPQIMLSLTDSTFEVGDSLELQLRVTDSNLKKGAVNINGSPVFVFENCKVVIDTILKYNISVPGNYKIKVDFTDGEKTTIKELEISAALHAPVIVIEQDSIIATSQDTIELRIRASDNTLKRGTIDFNDGTIITLSNISKSLDTTIVHTYKNNGSYLATVTFDDGYETASKTIKIAIKYYFAFNFEIGMKWKFYYKYTSYHYYLGESQSGIHEWTILSSNTVNNDIVFIVQEVRNDTIPESHKYITDTSTFNIICSNSRFQINWPTKIFGQVNYDVPNHVFVDSYPVVMFSTNRYKWFGAQTSYNNQTGPNTFSYIYFTDRTDNREYYWCIDYKLK